MTFTNPYALYLVAQIKNADDIRHAADARRARAAKQAARLPRSGGKHGLGLAAMLPSALRPARRAAALRRLTGART